MHNSGLFFTPQFCRPDEAQPALQLYIGTSPLPCDFREDEYEVTGKGEVEYLLYGVWP